MIFAGLFLSLCPQRVLNSDFEDRGRREWTKSPAQRQPRTGPQRTPFVRQRLRPLADPASSTEVLVSLRELAQAGKLVPVINRRTRSSTP
jgi:hypothetical protein